MRQDIYYRLRFHWDNTRQRIIDNGNSPWVVRKVILRLITAVLALIGVSLFAAAIEPWEGHFVHVKGPSRGDWQDALPIAPLLICFIYNLPNTIYVFWHANPVHAFVDSVMDFLVWVILGPAVVCAAWGGTFHAWQLHKAVESKGGKEVVCTGKTNESQSIECFLPALYKIGRLELGGVAVGGIVWTLTTLLLAHSLIAAIKHYKTRSSTYTPTSPFHKSKSDLIDLELCSTSPSPQGLSPKSSCGKKRTRRGGRRVRTVFMMKKKTNRNNNETEEVPIAYYRYYPEPGGVVASTPTSMSMSMSVLQPPARAVGREMGRMDLGM